MEELGKEGLYAKGVSVVPTVTNVNNVSLISGEYPDKHGIASNCYYDRTTDSEVYMESANFITAETILEKASKRGLRTALVTAKAKLLTLLNKGAQVAFSAEEPPTWVVKKVGSPPNIYSIEVNSWLFRALRLVLSEIKPDLTYMATTDYVMHKYGPKDPEARCHVETVDAHIGEIADEFNDVALYLTADHGMSGKRLAVNLEKVLDEAGIASKVIPTVKDRYILHHSNLSGSAFVYLDDIATSDRAFDELIETEGVEEVLTRSEASLKYHLPPQRIGDIFVNGKEEYVFGNSDKTTVTEVNIRSHGSLHEQAVPLFVHGAEVSKTGIVENKDLALIAVNQLIRD